MGLFDFVKDAGAKIFDRDKPKAESAEEQLTELRKANELLRFAQSMKLPVQDLRVEFDDGVATVHGTAESTAVKENIIIGIGNVEGVAQVDDRMQVVTPEPPAQFYTVKPGDSLSKIAKAYYGDPMKYTVIFEANQPMLKDPDLIYPGQVVRIPAIES